MRKSVSIEKFLRKFRKEYKFLYDNYDNVTGFRDAVNEFDYRIRYDSRFNRMVQEFALYCNDFISSDREAAAYMFTWAEMVERRKKILTKGYNP